MLFNSFEFIFVFLPLTVAVYAVLSRAGWENASRNWLVAASVFFYGWWDWRYVPIILVSVLLNFHWSRRMSIPARPVPERRAMLAVGVALNLSVLAFFKYTDFLIFNLNAAAGTSYPFLRLALPLAISFFTFQQIAYLVDSYRGRVTETRLRDYMLFVTFFPQLIAGPIVHHSEMLPQFRDPSRHRIIPDNWARGLFIFLVGLFKKTVVADRCGEWVSAGFDDAACLTFIEAWAASLAYTFQIYFDFSAYCDMATGAALFFNIELPVNFDSPYKSRGINEFWRRWHMTLGRCMRDYVYVPLGGSRNGRARTAVNLVITFVVGGLWHGAAWTFLLWGFLHGVAASIQREWSSRFRPLPRRVSWAVTFLFVHVTWVFFRARAWGDAVKVLKGMVGGSGFVLPGPAASALGLPSSMASLTSRFPNMPMLDSDAGLTLGVCMASVLFLPNALCLHRHIALNKRWALAACMAGLWALFSINRPTEFLYFNF
ncbi:MAG: MBOAT family protein [Lentisphaerae bacterium]|nr:MBOAT family protein [Lentisphaerota bacterium]